MFFDKKQQTFYKYYVRMYVKFGGNMKKVELLAPAGNMNALKAAVMAGCDAVYLGGHNFGARAFSKNFSNLGSPISFNVAYLEWVKYILSKSIFV